MPNVSQAHSDAHMKKNTAISVRVPKRVKDAAERAANDDNRSLASLVEKILIDHLKEAEYLK